MTDSIDLLSSSPFDSGLYSSQDTTTNSLSVSGQYFPNFSLTNIQALREKNRNELLKMMDSDSEGDLDEEEWEFLGPDGTM
jgi:hypothetical protein